VFDAADEPAFSAAADIVDENTIVVLNKTDLGPPSFQAGPPALQVHAASVLTGQGMEALLDGLREAVAGRIGLAAQPALTRARHREALSECHEALRRALDADLPELAAEDVRLAVRALGRITGRVDVEDLLDVIFRDFCIGK
jgi:tRNA modification GTPase